MALTLRNFSNAGTGLQPVTERFGEITKHYKMLWTGLQPRPKRLRQSLQQGVHRTVLRQLRRKFTQVPKEVVQHIEATSDLEQLDHWLDQIILANELAEIDFKIPHQNQ